MIPSDFIIEVAAAALFFALLALFLRSLSKDKERAAGTLVDDTSFEDTPVDHVPPDEVAVREPSTHISKPESARVFEPTDAEVAAALDESAVGRPESFVQFPSPKSSEVLDVFIGLDFGTSCSKVVIRSALYENRALAVPFGRSSDGKLQYLLPTRVCEHPDGTLLLGGGSRGAVHTDLKRALMRDPSDSRFQSLAAGYLALTLRKARAWFVETQRRDYGHLRLRWSLNMGIPSAWYDDSDLRKTFESVAVAAWQLSLSPTTSLELTREVLDEVEFDTDMEINVIPEIGAEVVGYLKSPEYRPGLHVIVDVGGGTLDVCGFCIHQPEGDNAFELFESSVESLGAYVLHERRYDAVEKQGVRPSVPRIMNDLLAPIPTKSSYVPTGSTALMDALSDVDERYQRDCTQVISKLLATLRRDRDPGSPNWQSGLPVFCAGGGADLKLIDDSLRDASDRLTRAFNVRPPIFRPLAGIKVHQVSKSLLPRLAVAYGLSFDVDDIGRFRNPREHGDIPKPKVRRPIHFISKDDV